jgi:hypothetical protein
VGVPGRAWIYCQPASQRERQKTPYNSRPGPETRSRQGTDFYVGFGALACEGLHPFRTDATEHHRGGGKERGLLEGAIGLGGAGFALDDAACRVLAAGVVAHFLQHGGVDGRQMPGLVDDEDGNVLRDGVQFFLGRVAQLLELRVVVAEADDELRLLDGSRVLLGPVAQRLLQ